jgi:hypothetical protein
MVLKLKPKHLLGWALGSLLCMLMFGGYLGYVVWHGRHAASYPGSVELSSQEVVKVSPFVYYRNDRVYRTGDYFPEVQRWYANAFGLVPQTQGQSNCASISNSKTFFTLTRVMTVTICDSLSGRLIYTERSWRLALP